ncbi:MAG: AraC family transcriptional regulator [Firmicutes bacterium]|nr:AraC family transcriptional regulator [Bacillota bacterium]
MSKAFYYKTEYVEAIRLQNHVKPYPPHNHVSVCAVGVVLRGEMALWRQRGTSMLGAGMVFAILPYETHALTPRGPVDMVSLCIPADLVWGAANAKLMNAVNTLFPLLHDRGMLEKNQASLFLYGINELLRMRNEQLSIRCPYVAEIRDLIERQPDETLRVERLAKAANLCKDHLIRLFKREVGLTPHKFQMQNRVRMAQRLIGQGVSIAKVAQATGFYDQSHLDKQFRFVMGISPIEYKKALSADSSKAPA